MLMTSKSIYTRTTLQIVKRALRTVRVIDAELPLASIDRQNGLDALNGFVKFLQTEGFNLWRETEALLVLSQGQTKYSLGESGDHCFNDDDFIPTTLSDDATAGDTLLSLTSTDEMQAAEEILTGDPTDSVQGWTTTDSTVSIVNSELVLTNGTDVQGSAEYELTTVVDETYSLIVDYTVGTGTSAVFYITDIDGTITSAYHNSSGEVRLTFTARQTTTNFKFANGDTTTGETSIIGNLNYINTADGDKIGVFLDDGTIQWSNILYLSPFEIADSLTGDAAADNVVYTYTDLIPRPMSINNCRYRASVDFNDIPTTEWTRQQYFEQPNKTTEGTVTKWYYSPQLTDGLLYVWQPTSDNKGLLPITYIRPLEVTDDNADSVDFPSEWYDLLAYGTANMLLAEYEVADKVVIKVESKYAELLEQALGFDNDGYMSVEIDYEGRR